MTVISSLPVQSNLDFVAGLADGADLPVLTAAFLALAPSLALLLIAALTLRRRAAPDKHREGFGV